MNTQNAVDQAMNLLAIASPTGYTANVTDWLLNQLTEMGFAPTRTRKGCVVCTLGGEGHPLTLAAHVDTLGLMVREIKANGRLGFALLGGPSCQAVETENVTVVTRDGRQYTGVVEMQNASVHVNRELEEGKRDIKTLEILLDENVQSREDVLALGIQNGDVICLDPRARVTPSGYIRSRFLDDKLSAGMLLELARAVAEGEVKPERKTSLFFSVYEEVGHGASAGIPDDTEDLLVVDMGCVGEGLSCTEQQVSICAKDSSGPYDYAMTGELIDLCQKHQLDYAVDVCNAVLDIMQPTPDRPMIINLPVTVEMSMPHVYANQIEYCDKHLKYRDSVIISTHPHNDRGTGVACAELAVLAGAQRVECCLFGNGERTGNVDAVTLAMNLYSHGVDPKLDFSDMPGICTTYERVTRMPIYQRSPYAGQLVFAAFSGSHQDAIAKGMAYRKEHNEHRWTCPYIPVDPHDIGRTYDADVIRINSQSGKGGIGFVLEQNYGYNLPPKMREVLGYKVKSVSDHSHKELSAGEVLRIFEESFLNREKPLRVVEAHFAQVNGITATVTLDLNGQRKVVTSVGNGRLDAVANAIQSATGMDFHLESYSEHSLDEGSTSRAASYVGLAWGDGSMTWGAGTDTDIIVAGIRALVSAINSK